MICTQPCHCACGFSFMYIILLLLLLWCVHCPSARYACTHTHITSSHSQIHTCVHTHAPCTLNIHTHIHTPCTNTKHTYIYTLVHTHSTLCTNNEHMHAHTMTLIAYTYCYTQYACTYIHKATYIGCENARQLLNVTFINQTFYK